MKLFKKNIPSDLPGFLITLLIFSFINCNNVHDDLISDLDRNPGTDNAPPVITAFSITSDTKTTDPNITFTLAGTDDIAITGWLINESASMPLPDAAGWSGNGTPPSAYTLTSGFGPVTIYAWAKDAEGNVSSSHTLDLGYLDATRLNARWKLDESAGAVVLDSSVNSLDGAITGATPGTAGVINTAFSFDGAGDYLDLPPVASNQNGFTIAMWINLSDFPQQNPAALYINSGPQIAKDIQILILGDGRLQLSINGNITPDYQSDFSLGAGDINQWHHIAVTYSKLPGGENVKFYVDGILDSLRPVDPASIQVNIGPGNIGSWDEQGDGSSITRSFHGKIDDIWIFTRELSINEIQALAY